MTIINVNEARLWRSIEEINQFGATPEGGVCRLEFSEESARARDLFVAWCREAGCAVRVDRFGNIFARRAGRDNSLPAVLVGSHLDTQTSGGRFDGIFGVMAGLEIVRTFNEQGIETDAPVELVVWTNEEGEIFKPMIGSAVWCGDLALETALELREAEGWTIREGLERMGYLGDLDVNSYPVKCYFEAHIEQGPVLELAGEVIGIVNAAQKQYWYDLRVRGREAHAGPTPMAVRRDALVAAARMVLAVDEIGRTYPEARSTCGHVEVYPNSRNTVPGEVRFTADLRNIEPSVLDSMDRDMRERCAAIAEAAGVSLEIDVHAVIERVAFNPTLVAWGREAAAAAGKPWREMFTGAGHDAVNIAAHYPALMIFVPCKDGISHNPAEDAKPEHLAAGAGVLATVVARAASHRGDL